MVQKEYDVYECEGNHKILIERKPEWNREDGLECMEGICCPACKEVATYDGTVLIEEPLTPFSPKRTMEA